MAYLKRIGLLALLLVTIQLASTDSQVLAWHGRLEPDRNRLPDSKFLLDPPTAPLLEEVGQSVTTPLNLMDGMYGVEVSPDGLNLYATSFLDDWVMVFDRDTISGYLTYQSAMTTPGINGPQRLAVSPDGEQVYVASGPGNSLAVLQRDMTTGNLSLRQMIDSGDISNLTGAYGVAVTPNGRFIYVSSVIDSAVVGFERMPDDTLEFRLFNSDLSNPDLAQTRNLAVSPDGLNLYVAAEVGVGVNLGNILMYQIDPTSGILTYTQTIHEGDLVGGPTFFTPLDGIGGAYDVAVSPDGEYVYLAASYDATVVVFVRDPITGELTYRQQARDGEAGVEGLSGASGIAITPDGRYVVATGYGDDAVAVFGRDPDNGRLTQVQTITPSFIPPFNPQLSGVRDVAITEDGFSVYVAAFTDDAIVGFQAYPNKAYLPLIER